MPIVDYKHVAEISKKSLFNREDISEANKATLKAFLAAYDVSPARQNIFQKHIGFLLCRAENIKQDMHNKDKINSIFNELRQKLSPTYYATIINVSLAFVRWLNEGEKPKGFTDIKNKPKKTFMRDLNSSDMLLWEDGLKMAEQTNSMQLKAIIMTQLDGGLRPSEFTDLNYGDVRREGKYMVLKVNGKTGKRDVILWDSIPFLQRWLQNHPLKKANSPLWLGERAIKGKAKNTRYDYFAMQMIVRHLGARSGIEKPLDFYNFRHSSAYLKKLKNFPLDLAAKNMGHSVEYFDSVYGRLSIKDQLDRMDKLHGLETEETNNINNPIVCNVCDFVNEPHKEHCEKCGSALSLAIALKEEKNKSNEIQQLKDEMASMQAVLKKILKEAKTEDIEKAIEIKKRGK